MKVASNLAEQYAKGGVHFGCILTVAYVRINAFVTKGRSMFLKTKPLLFFVAWLMALTLNAQIDQLKAKAEQGCRDAQFELGRAYEEGAGVEMQMEHAVVWYKKAAEAGHAGAQNALALCYELGDGVEKDLSQAVFWYIKAAEQGEARAQFNLGFCYENGKGVTKDIPTALSWYEKAALQGNANAFRRIQRLDPSRLHRACTPLF